MREILHQLSLEEKLRLLDLLWSDLLQQETEIPSPDWHREELKVREDRLKKGKEKIWDWREVKEEFLRSILKNA
ncbi:MAG: acyl-protein synthetase [Thermodesulfatator sp.]|nr:MAG: acyl-protein synthetase [Thermodesulfatator sp.]